MPPLSFAVLPVCNNVSRFSAAFLIAAHPVILPKADIHCYYIVVTLLMQEYPPLHLLTVSCYIASMENFLRLSVKINNILCVLIVLLSGLSYLVDMRRDKDVATWGIIVSLTFVVLLIVLSVLAKKGLSLMIKNDDYLKAYKVMRIGIVISAILLIIIVIGLAMGISTGTISYLYILLFLAIGFYFFCMIKTRPPKPDTLSGADGREYAEPLLDIIHEIPDTEFFEPEEDVVEVLKGEDANDFMSQYDQMRDFDGDEEKIVVDNQDS